MAKIIFVTGTGTDVGKTFIASLLVHKWRASYWKPIQTGIENDAGDTMKVSKFPIVTSDWKPKLFTPKFELQKPLSPFDAMKFEPEIDIKLSDFSIPTKNVGDDDYVVVEGAGGVFVPITKSREITTDLIHYLISTHPEHEFAIVVVADSSLGTLNHTLLTMEHLVNHGLKKHISGCILNGAPNAINSETIQLFGVRVLCEINHCVTNQDLQLALDKVPSIESLYIDDQ